MSELFGLRVITWEEWSRNPVSGEALTYDKLKEGFEEIERRNGLRKNIIKETLFMTELEKIIDKEVGNDTERERTTYLKYIELGRRKERESSESGKEVERLKAAIAEGQGLYEELDRKNKELVAEIANHGIELEKARVEGGSAALSIVTEILKRAGDEAAAVEKNERIVRASLKDKAGEGAIKAEMIGKYEILMSDVDTQHTAILRKRDQEIDMLRASLVQMTPPPAEEVPV